MESAAVDGMLGMPDKELLRPGGAQRKVQEQPGAWKLKIVLTVAEGKS
jgi:hypothetical protein